MITEQVDVYKKNVHKRLFIKQIRVHPIDKTIKKYRTIVFYYPVKKSCKKVRKPTKYVKVPRNQIM